jgi:hypothetical protein
MESIFDDYAMLYDTDVENYQNMSDEEKHILMSELVPTWDTGIQKMMDKIAG